MLVHGPSSIGTHPSLMSTDTFASVVTGGNRKRWEKGVGVGVGVGVIVGVGVAVGVAVGVGVGVDAVYSIVSTGGLVLSRVSNRFDVGLVDSSPNSSQPKLVTGLFSHDCTSATICAELHTNGPMSPTNTLAPTRPEKSPPCVAQKIVV